jgi:hypothetical protein
LAAQLPKKLPPPAFQMLNEVPSSLTASFLLISLKEAALVPSAHEKFYCVVTEKLTTKLVET